MGVQASACGGSGDGGVALAPPPPAAPSACMGRGVRGSALHHTRWASLQYSHMKRSCLGNDISPAVYHSDSKQ